MDTAHFGRGRLVSHLSFGFTCNGPRLSYYWISYWSSVIYRLLPADMHTLVQAVGFYFCSVLIVLMNALYCLAFLILNPGGYMESMLGELGEDWPGPSLCAFACLECCMFQLNLPLHAHQAECRLNEVKIPCFLQLFSSFDTCKLIESCLIPGGTLCLTYYLSHLL